MHRGNLIVSVRHYLAWEDNDGVVHKELDGDTIDYTCESIHVSFTGSVTFFSSGKSYTVPQEDIAGISFHISGANWCPHCDQSIEGFQKAL